ncbi:MAG: general secretion pathway protein GspC, partial [Myxococcales bacterium]|nr:general secretion pathway protein GspC [Myxococcales bacterium]
GVPELAILEPDAVLPRCEGSVRLSGAIVSEDRPSWSFAAIIGAAGRAMLYRVGMNVDGRELVAIYQNRIVMTQSGSYCQLGMFMPGEAPAATASNQPTLGAAAAAKAKRPQPAAREGAISAEDMEAGITRVSDTQFTLQRSLVDRVLENQSELMRTARIIPHEQGGRTVGVKLYGIRRNSLLGQLGLQNGDMMRTLNGFDMSSPDSALEAYARLRGADHLTLQVVRRGQPITVDYNIQ